LFYEECMESFIDKYGWFSDAIFIDNKIFGINFKKDKEIKRKDV